MRLVCPACGAVASFEAWVNDVHIRQFFSIYMQLPYQIQPKIPDYLALFRQTKTGDHPAALNWKRAGKILQELKELIDAGTVQWERGEPRRASPRLWAEALERVLERKPKGLRNHNYLRHVAYELAGQYREGKTSGPGHGETVVSTGFVPPEIRYERDDRARAFGGPSRLWDVIQNISKGHDGGSETAQQGISEA